MTEVRIDGHWRVADANYFQDQVILRDPTAAFQLSSGSGTTRIMPTASREVGSSLPNT